LPVNRRIKDYSKRTASRLMDSSAMNKLNKKSLNPARNFYPSNISCIANHLEPNDALTWLFL